MKKLKELNYFFMAVRRVVWSRLNTHSGQKMFDREFGGIRNESVVRRDVVLKYEREFAQDQLNCTR